MAEFKEEVEDTLVAYFTALKILGKFKGQYNVGHGSLCYYVEVEFQQWDMYAEQRTAVKYPFIQLYPPGTLDPHNYKLKLTYPGSNSANALTIKDINELLPILHSMNNTIENILQATY